MRYYLHNEIRAVDRMGSKICLNFMVFHLNFDKYIMALREIAYLPC